MKRIAYLTTVLALVLSSCGKNKEEREAYTQSAQDQAYAEGLWQDVGDQVETNSQDLEENREGWSNCTTVTIDTLGSPFPLQITIDFGQGCTGLNGRVRKGKLIYTVTGWLRETGSSITCTPQDYFLDNWGVEGTRTVTNKGENGEGNLQFDIEVSNAVVTDPDGETIEWNSTRTRTWVEGFDTGFFTPDGNGGTLGWDGILDDVYEITGSANGTNRNDVAYWVEITSPLRVEAACRWITEGVIEITPEDLESRELNYGDGVCDDNATMTIKNKEYQVILSR